MSGNIHGTLFTVTTFGESHGPAIGCVVDGCPPRMELSEQDIQPDLDSSIRLARQTSDIDNKSATIETHGRHDPCVGIRATPIAEAFLALVLVDHAAPSRAGCRREGAG